MRERGAQGDDEQSELARKQQKLDQSEDDEKDSDGEDAFMMDLENEVKHALEVEYPVAITPDFNIC